MKRKAEEELLPYREAPYMPTDPFTHGDPRTLRPAFAPSSDQVETALSDDDVESHDDRTDGTGDARSTPVTTAVSTASRRFPSDLKTIPCTWPGCPKTFNRPARLTAHLRSHNNDRPFKCTECPKTYMEEKHLRQHIKGSHSQERQYVCTACGRAFLTATRLRRHAAVHEGQDRFRCRGYDAACTRTFRKHQTLQRHIRVDHLDQPAFVCSRAASQGATAACGAVFESAGALRRHMTREHGTAKYWCEECLAENGGDSGGGGAGDSDDTSVDHGFERGRRAGFATKALLEAHMRQEHVSCLFCDARCAGPAALHRHIDMHHSGKTVADRKTTVCPYSGCGKTFTRRANLNVHIRAAHEGLRFVCGTHGDVSADVMTTTTPVTPADMDLDLDAEVARWDVREGCGRGFVSKRKLAEHIRYVHLGQERPPPAVVVSTTAVPLPLDHTALPPVGAGLLDDLAGTRHTLACPAAGCTARFVRHHDLRVHQQRDHGGDDPSFLFAGPTGGDGLGEQLYLGPDDGAMDPALGTGDLFATYMDLGLPPPPPPPDGVVQDEAQDEAQWQMDEAEMRCLIGEDMGFLDPQLFA